MQLTLALLVAMACVALLTSDAEACGRRRRRRRRGGSSIRFVRPGGGSPTPPTPIVTRPPPPPPTPQPSPSPTPNPTPNPTPAPTPPPPPPPFVGSVPGAPTPIGDEYQRPNCRKQLRFLSEPRADDPTKKEFREVWEYECIYNVYTEIDLPTFDKTQTCACGIVGTTSQPSDPTSGAAIMAKRAVAQASPRSTDISVNQVYFVGYNTELNKPVCVIQNFNTMEPSGNLSTQLLANAARPVGEDPNWSQHASGFAGQVTFDETPPCLDITQRENQANVPAMCFEVVAKYRTEFRWPENDEPIMDDHPNLWESPCYPCDPDKPTEYLNEEVDLNVASKKRQMDIQLAQQNLYCKMWYVFNKAKVATGGANINSREITARYLNNQCQDIAAYFSVDAEFSYALTRHKHAFGAFEMKMEYVKRSLVFGTPTGWSSGADYFTKSYYTATWTQPWIFEDGDTSKFRVGTAYKGLAGEEITESGIPPQIYKVCDPSKGDVVPAAWQTCTIGAGGDCPYQAVNHYDEDVVHWPMDNLQCAAIKTMATCSSETTIVGFLTPGRSTRMLQKLNSDTRMMRGPLVAKCQELVINSFAATWDPIVFRAVKSSAAATMMKRGVAQTADDATLSIERDDTGYIKSVFHEPVEEFKAVAPVVIIQPAVGSADAETHNPAGDHPISLFPETYSIAVPTDPADTSCGSAGGSTFDDGVGCDAWQLEGRPPCIDGALGCSCRLAEWGRPLCDAPLSCSSPDSPADGHCLLRGCPAGDAGCLCDANGACAAGLQCADGHCVQAQTACTVGANGCYCNADATCSDAGATCDAGVCVAPQAGCTPGAGGCACPANAACAAPFTCDGATGMCVAETCSAGDKGCPCAGGLCGFGFECVDKAVEGGVCVTPSCDAGDAGCPCAANDVCNDAEHECVASTIGSTEKLCLASTDCTPQTERCVAVCGAGNVAFCPPCAHQDVVCVEMAVSEPSPATRAVVALVAVALAAIASLL